MGRRMWTYLSRADIFFLLLCQLHFIFRYYSLFFGCTISLIPLGSGLVVLGYPVSKNVYPNNSAPIKRWKRRFASGPCQYLFCIFTLKNFVLVDFRTCVPFCILLYFNGYPEWDLVFIHPFIFGVAPYSVVKRFKFGRCPLIHLFIHSRV